MSSVQYIQKWRINRLERSGEGERGTRGTVAIHSWNVRFQNVRFQSVGFHSVRNVTFTKRHVYKMSGLQNRSGLQNVRLQNVRFQNVLTSKYFQTTRQNIHILYLCFGEIHRFCYSHGCNILEWRDDWVFADFHKFLFLEAFFPFSLILSF